MPNEPRTLSIIVEPDGASRHLVTSESDEVFAGFGEKDFTWRNSHVETWNSLSRDARDWLQFHAPSTNPGRMAIEAGRLDFNWWWADMLPVEGPVLGPYGTHGEAIRAEVRYLHEHNLPVPKQYGRTHCSC